MRRARYWLVRRAAAYDGIDIGLDSDGDRISDLDEVFYHRSDPHNRDSDGGGVEDGVEIRFHSTDPAFGFDDGYAFADTDRDGLIDGDEVYILHVTRSERLLRPYLLDLRDQEK